MKYLKDTVMNKIGLFTLIALIFSTSCNNKERGIINETMLNDNRYSLINAWESLKHGIYIYTRPQINPKTMDLETDMMSFDIISIEK